MLPGAPGEDDFAFWVAQFPECGGCHVVWHVYFCAEHGGGCVDFLDIYEDSGSEPYLVEGTVIFSHCLVHG